MSRYLQVKVEDICVLLPALQVHEVTSLEGLSETSEAHVVWRDTIIAFTDLARLLDRPGHTTRRYGVVYSMADDHEAPVMLQVDEVLGLRSPVEADWRALPELRSQASVWLDGLWLEPPLGQSSFRLRHPIRQTLAE